MRVPATGLIGAGTNNARLAGMLRGLGSYYYKEPTLLFLVRVAQGLVHLGKGLLNLAPTHTDGQLVSGARMLAPAATLSLWRQCSTTCIHVLHLGCALMHGAAHASCAGCCPSQHLDRVAKWAVLQVV